LPKNSRACANARDSTRRWCANEPNTAAEGTAVTAGFLIDVPARFDTDFLEVDLAAFAAGEIPSILIIEIRT
jgi:uncharacterized protein (TIGR02217 family)